MSSAQLAAKSQTDERYLREWLASQAAGGYITYDEKVAKFFLTEEQAFALAQEDSPAYLPGAFELALGSLASVPRIVDSFRTGEGMGWHEHVDSVFHGCEKFFRPGYAANLVSSWIPALQDVEDKLRWGARVADVGCGKGSSTLLLAKAFPKSQFFGFDYHYRSIAAAREAAMSDGIADRVKFGVSKAKDFPGQGYDLVTFFDCLHDMGDPKGAAEHVRQSLAKDGTWMIVEPFANDELKDNLNPVGRVYYSFFDPTVHALLAIPRSGTMPRRSGRRETNSCGGDLGRFQPVSPGYGNPVQYSLRSSAIRGTREIGQAKAPALHAKK